MNNKIIIVWLAIITVILVVKEDKSKLGKIKFFKLLFKNILVVFGLLILLFSLFIVIYLDVDLDKLVDIFVPLGTILLTIGLSNFFADRKDKVALEERKVELAEEKYLQIEMSVRPIIDIHSLQNTIIFENIGVGNAINIKAYDMDRNYEALSFQMPRNNSQYINLQGGLEVEIPCFKKNNIEFKPKKIIFILTNIMLTEIYFTTLEFVENEGIKVVKYLYTDLNDEIKNDAKFAKILKEYVISSNISTSFLERYNFIL